MSVRNPVVEELLRLFPDTEKLLAVVSTVGTSSVSAIKNDFRTHLAHRLFFILLGHASTATNFDSISKRTARLLGIDRDKISALIEEIALSVVRWEIADSSSRRGLTDLPYPQRRKLFEKQSYRCGICGLDFRSSDCTPRTKFESRPALDHKIPYRLGGDSEMNLWILCGLCNSMKKDYCHVGENGRIWIDNHVFHRSTRSVAFWTLWRDRQCTIRECGLGPMRSRLYVLRLGGRGPYVLDNCTVSCEVHRESHDAIEY